MARLVVSELPLALLLDIDLLRGQLGRWRDDPESAGIAARRLALAMIRAHLEAGFEVVVPQFLVRLPFVLELEQVAAEAGCPFVEIVLVSDPDEAAARFAARGASLDPVHRDAALLQQAPGARPIEELYVAMLEMTASRPGTRVVASVPGDIDGTLARVRAVLGMQPAS